MIYTFKLPLSPGTEAETPAVSQINLTVGVLKTIEIMYPAGCAGQVGVRIKERERVIFPSNPDEWFIDDDRVVRWSENYKILPQHVRFKLEGYNEDDTYTHTIYFRFNILEGAVTAVPISSGVESLLAELV